MTHYFYITPDEYEQAAKNGVSKATLNWRVQQAAWPKEKAISTPPRKQTSRKKWKEVAKQNHIPYHLFLIRINQYGWTEERASTQPLTDTKRRQEIMKKAKAVQNKFPTELIDLANSNGIGSINFYNRVRLGWDVERAATEPLWSDSKKGSTNARKVRERYGDVNSMVFKGGRQR